MASPYESNDHNLHFWVGAMFAGSGVATLLMLDGERISTGLQSAIVGSVILGIVLMVRYPLRRHGAK